MNQLLKNVFQATVLSALKAISRGVCGDRTIAALGAQPTLRPASSQAAFKVAYSSPCMASLRKQNLPISIDKVTIGSQPSQLPREFALAVIKDPVSNPYPAIVPLVLKQLPYAQNSDLAAQPRGGRMGIMSKVMFRSAIKALPRHNGVMTWGYSQMDFSVMNIIRENTVSAKGICKALSAQWIVDHAYGGALANRMLDASGKFNSSAVRMIMQNFILAWGDQDDETASFLVKRGVLERKGSRSASVTSSRRVNGKNVETTRSTANTVSTVAMGGANGNVGLELSQALRKVSNCYAQISFGAASGTGHATAAWVGGSTYGSEGDAMFYDPNMGEVWFERKKDFFEWFKAFYQSSYQGFPCNFNGRWEVTQWALANGADKGAYAKAVLSVAGAR